LQIPLLVGLVVDPLVPTKEPQEPTTVTPAEIIYQRRVRVLDRAGAGQQLVGVVAEVGIQRIRRTAYLAFPALLRAVPMVSECWECSWAWGSWPGPGVIALLQHPDQHLLGRVVWPSPSRHQSQARAGVALTP
jgi:hypothetical protein